MIYIKLNCLHAYNLLLCHNNLFNWSFCYVINERITRDRVRNQNIDRERERKRNLDFCDTEVYLLRDDRVGRQVDQSIRFRFGKIHVEASESGRVSDCRENYANKTWARNSTVLPRRIRPLTTARQSYARLLLLRRPPRLNGSCRTRTTPRTFPSVTFL